MTQRQRCLGLHIGNYIYYLQTSLTTGGSRSLIRNSNDLLRDYLHFCTILRQNFKNVSESSPLLHQTHERRCLFQLIAASWTSSSSTPKNVTFNNDITNRGFNHWAHVQRIHLSSQCIRVPVKTIIQNLWVIADHVNITQPHVLEPPCEVAVLPCNNSVAITITGYWNADCNLAWFKVMLTTTLFSKICS